VGDWVLSKVLVMVDEIWQPPLAIDNITSLTDRVGQRAGATTEHSHFANIAMFLLYKLEE